MRLDKRNKALIAGCVLLSIMAYKLAISKTWQARREYKDLRTKSLATGNLPQQLALLSQKKQYYDSVMAQMDLGDTSVQNNLLRAVNEEAQKRQVKVMDFDPPHVHASGEHDLLTHSFVLNGNYTDILQVVHHLESKGNFGEVVHLDFEKKRDYSKRKPFLEAVVFVQHFE